MSRPNSLHQTAPPSSQQQSSPLTRRVTIANPTTAPQHLTQSQAGSSGTTYVGELTKFFENRMSSDSANQQKTARSFKQEVTFLKDKEKAGQFFAYCVVSKESGLGLSSNERFLVLDSQKKQLKYYSDVPDLPLMNKSQLRNPPKEVIALDKVKKFAFAPVSKGISQVEVTWVEGGGSKHWRLTMGTRHAMKDFGRVIEAVRTNQHLRKASPSHIINSPSNTNQTVKNSKPLATPFIQDVKKLQDRQSRLIESGVVSQKVDSKKADSSIRDSTIVNRDSNIEIKAYDKGAQNKSVKDQSVEEKKGDHNTTQPNRDSVPTQERTSINIEDIIRAAEEQHRPTKTKKVEQAEQTKDKRLTQLDEVLHLRDSSRVNQRHSQNSGGKAERLSASRVMVKRIVPAEQKTNIKKVTMEQRVTGNRGSSPKRQSSKIYNDSLERSSYEKQHASFRLSLLQERRKTVDREMAEKARTSTRHSHPRTEVSPSRSTKAQADWWVKWIMSGSKMQRGELYWLFVQNCRQKVMIMCGWDWHLLHRNGNEFVVQEGGVQYRYFMFREKSMSESLKLQEEWQRKLHAWEYLLSVNQNQFQLAVPLRCIVNYKGIKVCCTALSRDLGEKGITLSEVEDISECELQLLPFQNKLHICLNRCQIYRVSIPNHNPSSLLYVSQIDCFPKICASKGAVITIDEPYINRFIVDGIVASQEDTQQIEHHVTNKVIPAFLNNLKHVHPLSSAELEQNLNKYGLNLPMVPYLYQISAQNRNRKAQTILLSHLTYESLLKVIRKHLHARLLTKGNKQIYDTVHECIDGWLHKKQPCYSQVIRDLEMVCGSSVQSSQIWSEFVLCSVFDEMGISCHVKKGVPLEILESMEASFWEEISFDATHVSINFRATSGHYGYKCFTSSAPLLASTIFSDISDKSTPSDEITLQLLNKVFSHKEGASPTDSYLFGLLSSLERDKLRLILSQFIAPSSTNSKQSSPDCQCLYYSLYHNSTGIVLCRESLTTSLNGIRWVIKQGLHKQGQGRLREQLHRGWFWCRNCPPLLIELYDLMALFSQHRQEALEAMTYSLKSLQLVIHAYSWDNDHSWPLICQKSYQTANIHFQVYRLSVALEHYETCLDLISKVKPGDSALNEEFLLVYRKKAQILIDLRRVGEAIQWLGWAVGKLREWRRGSGAGVAEDQQFECEVLLMRCWQMESAGVQWLAALGDGLKDWVEETVAYTHGTPHQGRLTQSLEHRVVSLARSMWQCILNSTDHLNQKLEKGKRTKIYLHRIKDMVQRMWDKHDGGGRYTPQESYKHLAQLLYNQQSKQKEASSSHALSPSILLSLTISTLSDLSDAATHHQHYGMYDQGSQSSPLLTLECVCTLVGWEYSLGSLLIATDDYAFIGRQ